MEVLRREERMYTYALPNDICYRAGLVGYLRGDFGSGNEFWTSFFDVNTSLKTDEFKEDLDLVVNSMRKKEMLLCDRRSMCRFVDGYPDSQEETMSGTVAFFREDTGKYCFLIRVNPTKGDYNFYIYGYRKEFFLSHTYRTGKGIRFIDAHYDELFRISDGSKIKITDSSGKVEEYTCYFIDEYHTYVGRTVFHICEFAERMQANGRTYEPVWEGAS